MTGDYVAIIPKDPLAVPEAARVNATLEWLATEGVLQRRGDAWTTGPALDLLIKDPRPVLVDGANVLTAGKCPVTTTVYPFPKGHSGLNFEPIACRACGAELPFDEMLAVLGSATGHEELSKAQLTLVCFHCRKPNAALEHAYGMSGGFARFEIAMGVPTNRFMEPDKAFLAKIAEHLGCDVFLIQILQ